MKPGDMLTLSDGTSVDMFTDGSIVLEQDEGYDSPCIKLDANSVDELLRALSGMPKV